MVNRLEPLVLDDYTGGLNLRASQFQLGPNESPEMCNVAVDPLGGIYTRRGWARWNPVDIPVAPEDWDPRRAYLAQLADGTDVVYVADNGKIWHTDGGNTFVDSTKTCNAFPHLADFASFGDDTYIASGWTMDTKRRRGIAAMENMAALSTGNFNNDYLNPVHAAFPRAELVEAHAGYAFAAYTGEAGVAFPNRIRWSHPTSQDDWAEDDFFDIDIGGSRITALMSYEDHLLIFKNDSIWALYGYNAESWQLIQKSSTIGAMGPHQVTRNEQAVMFFSQSDSGGIYVYGGERPDEISSQLRRVFADLLQPELIWVGWLARKLWVTLPWTYDGPTADDAAVFVFDPAAGNGAWTYLTSEAGSLGPVVAGSNTDSQTRPMAVLRNTERPCVVRVDALEEAYDEIDDVSMIGVTINQVEWDIGFLMTHDGKEIIAGGQPGIEPFETYYRTPWLTAGWPTRKKSWRRPDFVVRDFNQPHRIRVQSFRDYEELNVRRQSVVEVLSKSGAARWGEFEWGDGTQWGAGNVQGAAIKRGSSFGMCRALQLRVSGMTRGARWGIDAIVAKLVLRRFR
jgi:hypothetical protein